MLSSVASLPPKIRVSDSCTRPQPPPPDCQGAHDEGNNDDKDDDCNNDAEPKEKWVARREAQINDLLLWSWLAKRQLMWPWPFRRSSFWWLSPTKATTYCASYSFCLWGGYFKTKDLAAIIAIFYLLELTLSRWTHWRSPSENKKTWWIRSFWWELDQHHQHWAKADNSHHNKSWHTFSGWKSDKSQGDKEATAVEKGETFDWTR